MLRLYKDRTREGMLPEYKVRRLEGHIKGQSWKERGNSSAGETNANVKLKMRGRTKPVPQSKSSEPARQVRRDPGRRTVGGCWSNPGWPW